MNAVFPRLAGLLVCLGFGASPVFAQSACDVAVSSLQTATGAGDAATSLQVWQQVQAAGCDEARLRAARAQVSVVMSRAAQGALGSGDIAAAEAFVRQAPGVHWSVQAVKGDIAAKRGDRAEAARI